MIRAPVESSDSIDDVVFKPWPGPTVEEILASPWFNEQYNQPGAIGWALSQPDGTVIDLLGEQITGESEDGHIFRLKESFEPFAGNPKLLLVLNTPIADHRISTIDIIGGTLTTMPDGRRVIINPSAVYAYTDSTGRYMSAIPIFKWGSMSDNWNSRWPWKVKIVP